MNASTPLSAGKKRGLTTLQKLKIACLIGIGLLAAKYYVTGWSWWV